MLPTVYPLARGPPSGYDSSMKVIDRTPTLTYHLDPFSGDLARGLRCARYSLARNYRALGISWVDIFLKGQRVAVAWIDPEALHISLDIPRRVTYNNVSAHILDPALLTYDPERRYKGGDFMV